MSTLSIVPAEFQFPSISLAEAKHHLKIDFDYEDDLIYSQIIAAVAIVENYTGRAIAQKDVVLGFSSFPESVPLEHFPVLDGNFTVQYYVNDVLTNLADAYEYRFDEDSGSFERVSDIEIELPDRDDAVQFSFTAGMAKDNLPTPLYQAMLLELAGMYEFRTVNTEIVNRSSMALMRPYKIWD